MHQMLQGLHLPCCSVYLLLFSYQETSAVLSEAVLSIHPVSLFPSYLIAYTISPPLINSVRVFFAKRRIAGSVLNRIYYEINYLCYFIRYCSNWVFDWGTSGFCKNIAEVLDSEHMFTYTIFSK